MDRSEVIDVLKQLPNWGSVGIECGIRADFRCEYCDRDLLASLADYKSWQQDHLVPSSLDSAADCENMAVACQPCNGYKSNWDPRSVAGTDASREELVRASRIYIAGLRKPDAAALAKVRAVVGWTPNV